jgi:hypothetical protein
MFPLTCANDKVYWPRQELREASFQPSLRTDNPARERGDSNSCGQYTSAQVSCSREAIGYLSEGSVNTWALFFCASAMKNDSNLRGATP